MTCWRWLILPKGWTIKNRIAKAAMEENMADAYQARSVHLMRLYQAWADGGAGLIITGNMMVDGLAMTRRLRRGVEKGSATGQIQARGGNWPVRRCSVLAADQSPRPLDAGQPGANSVGAVGGIDGSGQHA